jgi:hypothetical protein
MGLGAMRRRLLRRFSAFSRALSLFVFGLSKTTPNYFKNTFKIVRDETMFQRFHRHQIHSSNSRRKFISYFDHGFNGEVAGIFSFLLRAFDIRYPCNRIFRHCREPLSEQLNMRITCDPRTARLATDRRAKRL